jgi:putative ABC transport system permease protein
MTTLQLKKVARDLWINRSRSLMAVTAVAIGVIGIGTVLCAYQILVRELDANYARTRPPSAIITVHPADAHLVPESVTQRREVSSRLESARTRVVGKPCSSSSLTTSAP